AAAQRRAPTAAEGAAEGPGREGEEARRDRRRQELAEALGVGRRQDEARSRLSRAEDASALRAALVEAAAACVPAHELEGARSRCAALELQAAVQGRSVEGVQEALLECRRLGAPPEVLGEAVTVLREEARRAEAEGRLDGLVARCDRSFRARRCAWRGGREQVREAPLEVRAALREARAAGAAPASLSAAEAWLLGEETRHREAVRGRLQAVMRSPSLVPVEQALAEGREAGLPKEDLGPLETWLAERSAEAASAASASAARADLESAVRSRAVADLSAAIERAEAAGLEAGEIEHAESILMAEMKKQACQAVLPLAVQNRGIMDLRAAIRDASPTVVRASLFEETEQDSANGPSTGAPEAAAAAAAVACSRSTRLASQGLPPSDLVPRRPRYPEDSA
ncbi:unnamed protein product, partial [Prorocentrum cordatum]